MKVWKKILIIISIVILSVFLLVYGIISLIKRLMKYQENKLNIDNNVTDKQQFLKQNKNKNNYLFFKRSLIPMLILITTTIVYICYLKIAKLNIFDYEKEGFLTAFYVFKNFTLINKPHLEIAAIPSYILFICFAVSFIWFLINVLAHISRYLKIKKVIKEEFTPNNLIKKEGTPVDNTITVTNVINKN